MGVKVKVDHVNQKVTLNAEAKAALKKFGPSDERLKKILLGNDEKSMATSAEARWLSALCLFFAGYEFDPAIELRQKSK